MNYRLTIYPALELGNELYKTFTFETEGEMLTASESIADMLLFLQDKAKVMTDYSNRFVCEQFLEGEWVAYEKM